MGLHTIRQNFQLKIRKFSYSVLVHFLPVYLKNFIILEYSFLRKIGGNDRYNLHIYAQFSIDDFGYFQFSSFKIFNHTMVGTRASFWNEDWWFRKANVKILLMRESTYCLTYTYLYVHFQVETETKYASSPSHTILKFVEREHLRTTKKNLRKIQSKLMICSFQFSIILQSKRDTSYSKYGLRTLHTCTRTYSRSVLIILYL